MLMKCSEADSIAPQFEFLFVVDSRSKKAYLRGSYYSWKEKMVKNMQQRI